MTQIKTGKEASIPCPIAQNISTEKAASAANHHSSLITHISYLYSLLITHLYTRAFIAGISPASIFVNPKHLRPRSFRDAPIR